MPNLRNKTANNNMQENANSVDNTVENANANSQEVNQGTQEMDNSINPIQEVAPAIDYQNKFSESSKEALRLYEENKKLREELELKGNQQSQIATTDSLYPGFEELDEDSKNNLLAYTNVVKNKALEEINKNPAIAFAMKQYNEQVFDSALNKTIEKYPELASDKENFKNKYYNVNNVPANIETILGDVAKIYLFDKAKEIGAREESEKINRFESERSTAGLKEPTVKRSLDDWAKMASENPALFAKNYKEYEADLKSGKI